MVTGTKINYILHLVTMQRLFTKILSFNVTEATRVRVFVRLLI